jgi:hypothetical protein
MAAGDDRDMREVEIYASGVRQPEKILGLALELDVLPNLSYKVDTNHDVVFLEFTGSVPSASTLGAVFERIGLKALFVGEPPPEATPLKKTQRIS